MRTIVEYINENIRLDEAKKVKQKDLLDGLDKIEKWNSASNIKKLMSEYYSAGDAEDLKKEHWDACVDAVANVIDYLRTFLDNEEDDVIDLADLSSWVADTIVNADLWKDLNKMDDEGDWDDDSIINLFNTVSMKVCKEMWLID